MHGVYAVQSTLGANQLSWLLNDLARVNRAVTPWVVVGWHQPPVRLLDEYVWLDSACTATALVDGVSWEIEMSLLIWVLYNNISAQCRNIYRQAHMCFMSAVQLVRDPLQGGRVPAPDGGAFLVQCWR